MKEIFNQIAISIIDILPQGEKFTSAILEIKRLVGNVGFTGYYLKEDGAKKWLDIFNLKLEASIIEELYQLTQNEFPKHKNWNRAIYTLFPEAKMNIQYIWDEQLQDEVDRLNNEQKK